MRARWRRELDQQERADDQRPIGGALPQVARGAPWAESTASLAPIDAVAEPPGQEMTGAEEVSAKTPPRPAPFVIGSKVRRIDEPQVVLRVREIDPEGLIDGTPKALCTNSFAHGKWMALTELELV